MTFWEGLAYFVLFLCLFAIAFDLGNKWNDTFTREDRESCRISTEQLQEEVERLQKANGVMSDELDYLEIITNACFAMMKGDVIVIDGIKYHVDEFYGKTYDLTQLMESDALKMVSKMKGDGE